MLKGKSKIYVGWGAFCFVVLHFTFILIYALPNTFLSTSSRNWTQGYVSPIFEQTWGMFVPCPQINGDTEIRFYFKDGTETAWVKPTEKAKVYHNILRGVHYGELVLAESNLLYWVMLDLNHLQIGISDEFPPDKTAAFHKGYSYHMMQNYIWGNARYLFGKSVGKAEVKCNFEDVVTGEKGSIELPVFEWS